MARTLDGYLSGTNHSAEHIRDIGMAAAKDVEWISHLHSTDEEWLVVTGDTRLRKNKAEREAFKRANLKGFILKPAYQKTPMAKCCGIFVAKWDSMFEFISRINPPVFVDVSMRITQEKFDILKL